VPLSWWRWIAQQQLVRQPSLNLTDLRGRQIHRQFGQVALGNQNASWLKTHRVVLEGQIKSSDN
jgi:uncharacterized protein YfaT (DUF1175 family)